MDVFEDPVRLDQDYSSLQTFRIRNAILIRYLSLSLLGLVGLIVTIIIGGWRWWVIMTHFGPAVLWRQIHPLLWIAIGLGFIGGAGLYLLLQANRQEIQLSPMGIMWRKGRKLYIFRWTEIENIYITSIQYGIFDFIWANRTEVVLYLRSQKRLKIGQNFENFEKLVDTIKHYIYPLMFDKFRKVFNQGEPIPFGPIVLSSQGVLNGHKALKWQDIDKIDLQRGRLELYPIEETGVGKLSFPIHKIPNVELCLKILHHFGSQP
jgi:hypothetical protein